MSQSLPVVLTTHRDCAELANSPQFWRIAGSGAAVRVALPVDAAARERWQSELDRLLAICGCTAAALATLLVFAGYLVAWWFRPVGFPAFSGSVLHFSLATALAISAGGVVKMATLWHVRRRLRKLLLAMATTR